MRLSNQRYAWIDSLFALPEAVLYACLVDYFDRNDTPGKPDYTTLWEHIRECIDLAHRDGSIKAIVSVELTDYVERDEGLADTLHKFRSSGKRLFLLTNSAWDYTSTLMSYLLDGVRGGYPSWRNYFDIVVVSAAKPEFFTDEHPFVELDSDGNPLTKTSDGPVPARAHLFGRQPQDVPDAGARPRRSRAVRRRSHLRRHAAQPEVVQLAHGDGAAGAGTRDHDVRPAAARARRGWTAWTRS